MSFRIASTLSITAPPKNTLVMTMQSDQELIMVENNYLSWIGVTCFKDDEIKILINNDIICTKKIYNSDESKKSIIILNINEYISKHSILKLTSNFSLHFTLHFSNIKEVENVSTMIKESDLLAEENDGVLNNNNYIQVLQGLFD